MNTVSPVRSMPALAAPETSSVAEAASPLPPPGESAVGASAILLLQRLLLEARKDDTETGSARIEAHEQIAQKFLQDHFEALKKQAEEQSEDGGFFSGLGTAAAAFTTDLISLETLTDPGNKLGNSWDRAKDATIDSRKFWADFEKGALEVGKWAAVAGSVTVAVASGGAAAPIAALAIVGAVASCAAAADSTFGILEKLGVDADTAKWVDIALMVGGAVASAGAALGPQIAALLGDSFTTATASTTAQVVEKSAAVVDGVSATAGGGGALARVEVAAFQRDAELAGADATEALKGRERAQKRIQGLLDALKSAVESRTRGLERVTEAMTDQTASRLALVRG